MDILDLVNGLQARAFGVGLLLGGTFGFIGYLLGNGFDIFNSVRR